MSSIISLNNRIENLIGDKSEGYANETTTAYLDHEAVSEEGYSVSNGTTRTQDLIPVFLAELERLDPKRAKEIKVQIPDYALENTEDSWFDTEDAGWVLNEDLFDALNDVAPPGHYFGAHPSDGADYGFWLHEDYNNAIELPDIGVRVFVEGYNADIEDYLDRAFVDSNLDNDTFTTESAIDLLQRCNPFKDSEASVKAMRRFESGGGTSNLNLDLFM